MVEFWREGSVYVFSVADPGRECDRAEYRVDVSNHKVFATEVCRDGIKRYEYDLFSEEAAELLGELAENVDDLDAQLLAIAAGNPLDEYFLDARYVLGIRNGKTVLEAVELLPCMGAPGCKWIRVERGDSPAADLFLDHIEEILLGSLRLA